MPYRYDADDQGRKEEGSMPRPAHGAASTGGLADAADCIIFDCDGVLVDVSRSYYAAIRATVHRALGEMMHIPRDDPVSGEIIERFKNTGMYNDEIDLSCAIILAALLSRGGTCTYAAAIDTILESSSSRGIESVTESVRKRAGMEDALEFLEHPSADRTGRLCRIFDHMFFGSRLYRQVRGSEPPAAARVGGVQEEEEEEEEGCIRYDRVIMNAGTMGMISSHFGARIALVTGRGAYAASHTLGPLMKWFDADNSAFLEDEPRLNAKPNPARLDDCIRGMGCSGAIYVGDSVEDAMMARHAAHDVTFCGVTGCSADPAGRAAALRQTAGHGRSIMVDSVLDIPKALNLEP